MAIKTHNPEKKNSHTLRTEVSILEPMREMKNVFDYDVFTEGL
jgi:hypothetical protein